MVEQFAIYRFFSRAVPASCLPIPAACLFESDNGFPRRPRAGKRTRRMSSAE